MLRPVCVKDGKQYKVEECGVALVEYVEREIGVATTFMPYTLRFADLWVCPVCGHQILGGYGEVVAREHEPEKLEKLIETFRGLGKLYEVT